MSLPGYDENKKGNKKTVTFKYQQKIPANTPIQKTANVHKQND